MSQNTQQADDKLQEAVAWCRRILLGRGYPEPTSSMRIDPQDTGAYTRMMRCHHILDEGGDVHHRLQNVAFVLATLHANSLISEHDARHRIAALHRIVMLIR